MSQTIIEGIRSAFLGRHGKPIGSNLRVDSPQMCTSNPPWILHVEDDRDFSAALRTRLELHGVAVVRAFDGNDGKRCAFDYPADAIILDYRMPGCTGAEVLKHLRREEETRTTPVIILTAYSDNKLRREMLEAGATACLTKPLQFDQLLSVLREHIDIIPQPVKREWS